MSGSNTTTTANFKWGADVTRGLWPEEITLEFCREAGRQCEVRYFPHSGDLQAGFRVVSLAGATSIFKTRPLMDRKNRVVIEFGGKTQTQVQFNGTEEEADAACNDVLRFVLYARSAFPRDLAPARRPSRKLGGFQ